MSQIISEKKLWALVGSVKDNTKVDLQGIAPSIIDLVDEWQSKGNFIWSGPLDDNKTGMAIFEATEEDARMFYNKYDKICAGVLTCHLYQWDAIPILSMF